MLILPTLIEKKGHATEYYDIFSRLSLDRIIMIVGEIDEETSASVVAQLLFLDSQNHEDIKLYINSPGGIVTSGLAIYDVMNIIKSKVKTVCVGEASSMASFLLSSGTKGKRCATKSARIMIHQVLGGAQGQATDIEITTKEILRLKKYLTEILAKNCNKEYDKVLSDCERDFYMSAQEALEYGIIDEIIG